VGGPNGSGKSSFYQTFEFESSARSIWIINPDLLTLRIQQVEGLELRVANLQAVQRVEAWLEVSIRAHQTVGVETVLSTSKYRRLVEAAKALRFQVRLTYIILDSPERNIERVRLRVKTGGHAVPEDKIVERYARSLAQMPWFLDQARGMAVRQFRHLAAPHWAQARGRHHTRFESAAAGRCGRRDDQDGLALGQWTRPSEHAQS
jgi:predicted ABC-type ATPase